MEKSAASFAARAERRTSRTESYESSFRSTPLAVIPEFAEGEYPGPRAAECSGARGPWVPALRASRSGRDDSKGAPRNASTQCDRKLLQHHDFSAALQIAKFVQRMPQNETNCAIRTPGLSQGFHPFSNPIPAVKRKRQPHTSVAARRGDVDSASDFNGLDYRSCPNPEVGTYRATTGTAGRTLRTRRRT